MLIFFGILDYVVDYTIKLEHSAMKIMGSIKISPTADNPLSGMDPISKGSSIVIGHRLEVVKNEDGKIFIKRLDDVI